MKLTPKQLRGGKASGMRPDRFDPLQLKRGTRVEMEHTNQRKVAQRIAMDHLVEDPDYYKKLSKFHLDGFEPNAESIGILGGAMGGAALGGPLGAAFGAFLGLWLGRR